MHTLVTGPGISRCQSNYTSDHIIFFNNWGHDWFKPVCNVSCVLHLCAAPLSSTLWHKTQFSGPSHLSSYSNPTAVVFWLFAHFLVMFPTSGLCQEQKIKITFLRQKQTIIYYFGAAGASLHPLHSTVTCWRSVKDLFLSLSVRLCLQMERCMPWGVWALTRHHRHWWEFMKQRRTIGNRWPPCQRLGTEQHLS